MTLVHDLLDQVHAAWVEERSGEVLHGIPALENVDPDTFGICLATADGYAYEVGDTDLPFCIQSISKAFTYGMALMDNGTARWTRRSTSSPRATCSTRSACTRSPTGRATR